MLSTKHFDGTYECNAPTKKKKKKTSLLDLGACVTERSAQRFIRSYGPFRTTGEFSLDR